jgi:hypothetical protein
MKLHFKRVDEPTLKEGSNVTADCGAIVQNAAFAMKFDFDLGDIVDWNPFRICERCLEIEAEARFIYGLVNGEESRHAEAG